MTFDMNMSSDLGSDIQHLIWLFVFRSCRGLLDTWTPLRVLAAANVMNLGLDIAFVPAYGAAGASIATGTVLMPALSSHSCSLFLPHPIHAFSWQSLKENVCFLILSVLAVFRWRKRAASYHLSMLLLMSWIFVRVGLCIDFCEMNSWPSCLKQASRLKLFPSLTAVLVI